MWSIISFGKKHKGKSLPEVILHDPDWFFWAVEAHYFRKHPDLQAEARDLSYKACNIKIPRANPQEWRIRYVTTRDGKFADFEIIDAATPLSHDLPTMWRHVHLDLAVPRSLKRYDKLGYKLLLKRFRHHFLGSTRTPLTKRWCEDFFANSNNFLEVERRGGCDLHAA